MTMREDVLDHGHAEYVAHINELFVILSIQIFLSLLLMISS